MSDHPKPPASGTDVTLGDGASGDRRLPHRAPIDAYGNGGFRFADIGHRGSLLILPDGMRAWPIAAFADLTSCAFAAAIAAQEDIEVFLIGTGATHEFLDPALKQQLRADGLRIETMTTGAACRTYNVMLGEQRQVGAGLLAVD